MTVVRSFYVEVHLKTLLNEPGGIKVADAIDRAYDSLEEVRDQCLAAIDDKIAAIAAFAPDASPLVRRDCYQLSNEIFAEAGALGAPELSAVAFNLCEVLSADQTRVSAKIIGVHVDAMRVLRLPGAAASPGLRRAVLDELRRLGAWIGGDA